MRASFEKIPVTPHASFRVQERRVRRFDSPWHFHPEIELTLIVESRGRRFVGDSIESFAEGDLVLLGPNLPHFWHNEGRQPRGGAAHSIVVQFEPLFLGADFLRAPEAAALRRLIARATRGLAFSGRGAEAAATLLRTAPALSGMASLLRLFAILDELTRASARPLASEAYVPRLNRTSEKRLGRVYEFLSTHFEEPLTLPQIARVAAMTPEAFSRYFKRATGRNVSAVLTQLRVDHAAGQLLDSEARVADIALAAGFPTVSNFNRQFRALKKTTPRDFRARFKRAAIDLGPPGSGSSST